MSPDHRWCSELLTTLVGRQGAKAGMTRSTGGGGAHPQLIGQLLPQLILSIPSHALEAVVEVGQHALVQVWGQVPLLQRRLQPGEAVTWALGAC